MFIFKCPVCGDEVKQFSDSGLFCRPCCTNMILIESTDPVESECIKLVKELLDNGSFFSSAIELKGCGYSNLFCFEDWERRAISAINGPS